MATRGLRFRWRDLNRSFGGTTCGAGFTSLPPCARSALDGSRIPGLLARASYLPAGLTEPDSSQAATRPLKDGAAAPE